MPGTIRNDPFAKKQDRDDRSGRRPQAVDHSRSAGLALNPGASVDRDRRKGVVDSSTVDLAVHLGARDGPDYIPTPVVGYRRGALRFNPNHRMCLLLAVSNEKFPFTRQSHAPVPVDPN